MNDYWRGHRIEETETVSENKDRACGLCGGHGDDSQAYIQYKSGKTVTGEDAMKKVSLSKKESD